MKRSVMLKYLGVLLAVFFALPLFTVQANAADTAVIWTEAPGNFDEASEVPYSTNEGYIANWGVRGEHATFLTDYAESYYTNDYTYETLSTYEGDKDVSKTPSSELYRELCAMMNDKATAVLTYEETRPLFKYTDCMVGKYENISSFYSGVKLTGEWDSAKTWNREHTWPNSKIDGDGENDIMMLRPTAVNENSERANTAYGESTGYFDPNSSSDDMVNVHGDCARIVLYTYVRWGMADTMWGTKGAIENLDVLLSWMAEDPVDTWEMGRNDAVESITGVRNVFVDYPELAWKLFDQQMPADYITPSSVSPDSGHSYKLKATEPTCTEEGYTYYECQVCHRTYMFEKTEALGHTDEDDNGICDICGEQMPDPNITFRKYPAILQEGDYMIVSNGHALKASTFLTAKRLQYAEVTEDKTIQCEDESLIFHIAKNGEYWTIYNTAAGKYVAGTGEKNKAEMTNSVTDKALWTAVFTDGKYEFINNFNENARLNSHLRSNGSSGWACYSTTTGGPLTLYRNGKFTMPGYTVTWKDEDGTVLETDENVVFGTKPSYDGPVPLKPADAEYTYDFSGWDKDTSAKVTGDITFTAVYTSSVRVYRYNLFVGGIEITSLNKDDVFGDGTVSFNSENSVLTLNNALIETSLREDGNDPTIEFGLRFNFSEDQQKALTINLVGNNRIVNEQTAEGVLLEYGVQIFQAPLFTVTGSGTLEIDMQADNEGIEYVGINSRQKTNIDGAAIMIDIPGNAKTTGYELTYSNMLTLKNGASLSVVTGSNAETYSMANDREKANLTVEEGCVLEAESENYAFNSQFIITEETAALGAAVGTKNAKLIWDGKTGLSSSRYVRIPCDVPAEPAFRTMSLLLTGEIGTVFYMYLPEIDGVDYSESYMEFTVSGKAGETKKVDYDESIVNADGIYRGFICHVKSIQMADTITAVFHYGDDKTVEKEYSVKTYLDTVLNGDYEEPLKNLCAAINDYGYWAQQYLSSYRGWSIGTDYAAMSSGTEFTEADREAALTATEGNAISCEIGNAEIRQITYSLLLDSGTAIKLYMTPNTDYEGEITAYIGDSTENAAIEQSDGRYTVDITDILAHEMDKTHTVKVTAGETFEIKVSVFSYINAVLGNSGYAEDFKNTVTALYRYYAKTIEYAGNLS